MSAKQKEDKGGCEVKERTDSGSTNVMKLSRRG